MNNKIKITPKAGMKLKTRGGRDAKIYEVHDHGQRPIHGAILSQIDGAWYVQSWKADGRTDYSDQPNDLILEQELVLDFDWDCLSKWMDMYIAMDVDGDWFAFSDKPKLGGGGWRHGLGWGCRIPDRYAPKNFTESWDESLFMNPKYQKNGN